MKHGNRKKILNKEKNSNYKIINMKNLKTIQKLLNKKK